MLDFQEFIASFHSYTEGGDSRRTFAAGIVNAPPASIMAMSAGDFAAIVSFAASAEIRPGIVGKLRDIDETDKAALAELDELIARFPPAVVVDPKRPDISAMIAKITAAEGGARFMADVAAYLNHASTLQGVRKRIFTSEQRENVA